ncbi:L-histidine N(alpha)-methyltransferase [Peijinzhouia sedimentorum]
MTEKIQSELAQAVIKGLKEKPKSLPSWLFYDDNGDRIFQEIMAMPEYYLTNCELSILKTNKGHLLEILKSESKHIKLIELGAGDGIKTEILLEHFLKNKLEFEYNPVDVSAAVLEQLETRLKKNLPHLQIESKNQQFKDALIEMHEHNENRKFVLFMGANIGNFKLVDAQLFINQISMQLNQGDYLMVGFDLKKLPRIIQKAYDDPHGITSRFNLNLLQRLNNELDANFNINQFEHYSYYDITSGASKSYLVSKVEQKVYLKDVDLEVTFGEAEYIHTEVSQKYDMDMIKKLAEIANLSIKEIYFDKDNYFADVLFKKQ